MARHSTCLPGELTIDRPSSAERYLDHWIDHEYGRNLALSLPMRPGGARWPVDLRQPHPNPSNESYRVRKLHHHDAAWTVPEWFL